MRQAVLNWRIKLETARDKELRRSSLKGKKAVFAQITSAMTRAILTAVLVATPALVLPDITSDAQQFAFICAFFAAALVFIEYFSAYPSILEFRFAPPFNRIRFATVFFSVFTLSSAFTFGTSSNLVNGVMHALASVLGTMTDVPYSPVRLVLLTLPAHADGEVFSYVRMAAGVSYTASILSLVLFYFFVRVLDWPTRNGAFNVWVNLPLFDPTAGGDVLPRLIRDGRVNIVLGFLLPFIFPALVELTSGSLGPALWSDPQTLIWTMTIWAFFPASMVMRGIAMLRVANMIDQDRRRAYAEAQNLQHI